MSAPFIPCAGDHFYATCTVVYEHVVGGGVLGGQTTVVKQRDRSYENEIMLCIGRDATAIVAKRPQCGYSKEPLVMKHKNYTFEPVGPEVLSALQLNSKGEA